jgi:hypothetical protein
MQRPAQKNAAEVRPRQREPTEMRSARRAYIHMATLTRMTRACIGARFIIRWVFDIGLHNCGSLSAVNECDATTNYLDHGSGCHCATQYHR